MNRVGLWLVPIALLGAATVQGEEEHPPEPVGTSVVDRDNVTLHEAILPGDIVDWAVVPMGDEISSLVFLIERDEDESAHEHAAREVLLWDLQGDGSLESMGSPLSEEAVTVIGFDPQGDGKGEILVGRGGTVLGIGPGGEWTERFSSPIDLFPIRDTRGSRPYAANELVLRSVGLLQAFRVDPSSGTLGRSWQFELPLRVDRAWGGLRLETPPLAFLKASEEQSAQVVLGPEAFGKRRLRTIVLEPDSEGPPQTLEAWNILPTAEDIEESWYVEYGGEPALIVTTVMAEKHGVFEKKKLRLFSLSADRTRSGSRPLLEVMTRSRNWYGTCAGIADINGDGHDDLISAQPKGLGAGKLWVEGHIAVPGRGFEPKVRGSEIEVEEGERCTLAVDVTGDNRVDLVVVEDDSLLVFPLIQETKAKSVVEEDPWWRVRFEDVDGWPHPVDLSGQGKWQILVTGHTKGKRQAARVLSFR